MMATSPKISPNDNTPQPSSLVIPKSASFGSKPSEANATTTIATTTTLKKRARLDTDSQRGKRLFSLLLHHARPTTPTESDVRQQALQQKLAERLAHERHLLQKQLAAEEQAKREEEEARQREWELQEERRLKRQWEDNRRDRQHFLITKAHPPLMWLPVVIDAESDLADTLNRQINNPI